MSRSGLATPAPRSTIEGNVSMMTRAPVAWAIRWARPSWWVSSAEPPTYSAARLDLSSSVARATSRSSGAAALARRATGHASGAALNSPQDASAGRIRVATAPGGP